MNKAEQVLKRLEWSARYSYCTGWPCCPICKGIKPGHGKDENGVPPDNSGHRDNCELVAALTPNAALTGAEGVRVEGTVMQHTTMEGTAMFDEQPDGDIHGECAAEIERLQELVRWAYSKLHGRTFTNMDDALKLDEMKLLLEHGA